MLIDEAHIEFEVTLDKRYTSQAPEFPPEVIDYFLNEAQARFVKTRYNKNNKYQAGFEEGQKRTEDLKTLVVTEIVNVVPVTYEDDNYTQAVLADLSNVYWFYVKSQARVSNDACGEQWSEVKLVQQDDINRVLRDPFNNPKYVRPVIYFENGNILIVSSDDFDVIQYKLTYIKEPAQVNIGTYGSPEVQFDLPEHTHKEVVQLAADIAIENIESQRINTIKQQLSQTE